MKCRLHKFLFSFIGLLLAAILYLSFSSEIRLKNFCDEIFREELSANSLTLHYTLAEPENYNITQDTVTLGSYDIDTRLVKRELAAKQFYLKTIARRTLPPDYQKIYDLLNHCLETEMEYLNYMLLEEPLVPSIGIQSQLPILLAEYTFESETDVENYFSLLSCVPEYFNSLMKLEEEKISHGLFMDPESTLELITFCKEFLSEQKNHFLQQTFEERLKNLSLPVEKAALYKKRNFSFLKNSVYPAYEKLQKFLEEHKDSGNNVNGLFYLPEGNDYYAWLLRSEIGCNRSFEEIEAILDHALKEDAKLIAQLTNENLKLLDQRTDINFDISNPAALTTYLAKRSQHDFPKIPEVHFEICNVPKSMEPHLSPAFYLIPAIDRRDQNMIYLNHSSLTDAVSFFTTLAHESYPGHLYQTVYENSKNSHPVNRLLYCGGYTEGWATYAEQLSYYYAPISEDLAALLSTTRAMTLNLYSHLDLYVHAYGWTEEDCSDYLKKFGITGSSSIHNIFMLVKQQPANYLKYYLGYLEICMLRDEAKERLGDRFDLKEFHKFVLDYGPAPFELLEIYMEEWLKLHF